MKGLTKARLNTYVCLIYHAYSQELERYLTKETDWGNAYGDQKIPHANYGPVWV